MFTIEQLKQLSNFLIEEFKEVFATKEDLREIEQKIDTMQNNIDGFMKITMKNEQEILVMGHRTDNLEQRVGKLESKQA